MPGAVGFISGLLAWITLFAPWSGANNDFGNGSAITERSPWFVDTRTEIQVARKGMAVLPCSVHHLGDRQVVWRRVAEDEFLTVGSLVWKPVENSRILVDFRRKLNDVTSWDLVIRNAHFEDAGQYECQITSIELLKRHIHLKVFEKKTSDPWRSGQTKAVPTATSRRHMPSSAGPSHDPGFVPREHQTVRSGLPIRLACNTTLPNRTRTNRPRTSLEWFKDGGSVFTNTHVLLTRYQYEKSRMYVSQLFIDRASESDSGEYLCRLGDRVLYVTTLHVLRNQTNKTREGRAPHYGADPLHARNSAVETNPTSSSSHSTGNAFCSLTLSHYIMAIALNIVAMCATSSGMLTNHIDFEMHHEKHS